MTARPDPRLLDKPRPTISTAPTSDGDRDPQLVSGYWNHLCRCGLLLPRHLPCCPTCAETEDTR